ncbi:alpha/beta hydrolase [Demequina sediminicola]|uniref:alpha/beta hydrolase n=1 Tax=Demequina sediminicola TaxID=1095026 RepID=UPI0007833B59|nr:alpha/beta hydrolase-fold protein [Demequina sediminicola]
MADPLSVRSPHFADAPSSTPVLVLLHGYGSHEQDLPGITAWLPRHLPWISFRAPLPMPGGGAAWFPLSLPDEPAQGPVDMATSQLWEWLDAEVPERPLVPLGFSQGGLMATQLLRTRPERIAATVMLAGFVTEDGSMPDETLAQHQPEVFWGRGDRDSVIWLEAVHRTDAWLNTSTRATIRNYPNLGHAVNESELQDVAEFLTRVLAHR